MIELGAGDAKLVSDDEQHFTFVGVQFAVSERRLQLNFQKHPNQIEAPKADAAQLTHLLAQRIVVGLAVAKRLLRRRTRCAVQVHAIHQHIGDMNISFGDATLGFGQMPHHFKGGGKEERLAFLLIGEEIQPATARPVKHMAHQKAEHDAPKPTAHQQSHCHANHFTQILHRLPNCLSPLSSNMTARYPALAPRSIVGHSL